MKRRKPGQRWSEVVERDGITCAKHCSHPLSEDGRTCIYWTRCPANSDIEMYRSVYESALAETDDADRARSVTEAYFSGRMTAQMLGIA